MKIEPPEYQWGRVYEVIAPRIKQAPTQLVALPDSDMDSTTKVLPPEKESRWLGVFVLIIVIVIFFLLVLIISGAPPQMQEGLTMITGLTIAMWLISGSRG